MSLYDVAMNLTRLVPDTPLARSQTAVHRALQAIYDQTDWSFQKGFAGWLAPGMVLNGVGTFTTTPYSNQIIADATATAALEAYTGQPLITQLQYRNPAFAIYDIIGKNTTNPEAAIAGIQQMDKAAQNIERSGSAPSKGNAPKAAPKDTSKDPLGVL